MAGCHPGLSLNGGGTLSIEAQANRNGRIRTDAPLITNAGVASEERPGDKREGLGESLLEERKCVRKYADPDSTGTALKQETPELYNATKSSVGSYAFMATTYVARYCKYHLESLP